MNATVQSGDLFGPAEINPDTTKRALDELFSLTSQYKSAKAYHAPLAFIGRFRFYSPFNAMLVHIQMPGAVFVASPSRWLYEYNRRIKPGAQPLVILQPMGPVMFVFDFADTEPQDGAPPLPEEVLTPFEPHRGKVVKELEQTIENAKRDGVRITSYEGGSQSAGMIQVTSSTHYQSFVVQLRPKIKYARVKVLCELLVNQDGSPEARYATMAHDLGHLYCGHLGTRNAQQPDKSKPRPLTNAEGLEQLSLGVFYGERDRVHGGDWQRAPRPANGFSSKVLRIEPRSKSIRREEIQKTAGMQPMFSAKNCSTVTAFA